MTVKVKICGVTSAEDALAAAAAGADLLGLNFYPPSPRCLSPERALEIARAVRATHPGVLLVGVFVNLPRWEVEAIDGAVGLDLLQFSGDETPGEVAPYAARAIKVFRTGGAPPAAVLDEYPDLWGILVDAWHGSLYGGTGEAWDFSEVAPLALGGAAAPPYPKKPRRLLVAGGLGPGTAREAARASGAWGLDVCSGRESAPGRKDPHLLSRLFEEIRDG